uniref:Uncharacterized protein n=1 Tax=Acrobeloides nanus TaxID=290746 RepID=A0A914DFK7_9BILA
MIQMKCRVLLFVKKNMPCVKMMKLSPSPDLNPLDYAIWSILMEKACQKPHPNVESLKRALKKAWKGITLVDLVKIVDNFPKRFQACIDANGGHFE